MTIPPGPQFILRHVPHFLIPSLATYAALVIIAQFGWELPRWAWVTTTILARPVLFLLSQSTFYWRLRRAAKAHGAVLAPAVPKSSLECARAITYSVTYSWQGDVWFDWARLYGETYSWMVFSDYMVRARFFCRSGNQLTVRQIFTTEPIHLKVRPSRLGNWTSFDLRNHRPSSRPTSRTIQRERKVQECYTACLERAFSTVTVSVTTSAAGYTDAHGLSGNAWKFVKLFSYT